MPECNCLPEEREVIPTVPWQSDFCGTCGNETARKDSLEA